MALALLGVRLLLALVFVAAGMSKLRDRRGFSHTLAAFDVPRAILVVGATLIPLTELAVGLSLLHAGYATAGAVATLALLAVFTAAIAFNLSRGRSPDCACFGSAAAEPIGAATIGRNAVLAVLGLFVLLAGPGGEFMSAGTVWADATAGERVLSLGALTLLVAIGGLSLYASRLRATNVRLASRVATLEGQLRVQPEHRSPDLDPGGLSMGTAAPAFDLPRLEGDRASLASLIATGRSVALIFLSAHCPACHELWPDIERWQAQDSSDLVVVEVCSGSPQAIEMKAMGYAATNVLLEGEARVADAYAMSLKPSAVIVGPTGLIESTSVAGVGAIRALVAARIG